MRARRGTPSEASCSAVFRVIHFAKSPTSWMTVPQVRQQRIDDCREAVADGLSRRREVLRGAVGPALPPGDRGVVDVDVDSPERVVDGLDRVGDRPGVRDVRLDRDRLAGRVRQFRRQLRRVRVAPRPQGDGVALGCAPPGERRTERRADTADHDRPRRGSTTVARDMNPRRADRTCARARRLRQRRAGRRPPRPPATA